jgi:hypothetical protein
MARPRPIPRAGDTELETASAPYAHETFFIKATVRSTTSSTRVILNRRRSGGPR